MSCREHSGGRLATALARDTSGLNDVQTLSTLHQLIRQAGEEQSEVPEPTRTTVKEWATQTIENALERKPEMSDVRRRRLQEWATQIDQEPLPTAVQFYAWQKLPEEAEWASINLTYMRVAIANHTGYTLSEVSKQAQKLERQYAATPRQERQSLELSEEEKDAVIAKLSAEARMLPGHTNIPQDKGTIYALRHLVEKARIADAKGYPKLETYRPSDEAGRKFVQSETTRVICEYSGLTDCELGCGVHNMFIVDRGNGTGFVQVDAFDFERSRKPGGNNLTEEYWPTIPLDEEYWPGQHFHLSERLGRCAYCGEKLAISAGAESDSDNASITIATNNHTCNFRPALNLTDVGSNF